MPRGYGIALICPDKHGFVIQPIPLNLVSRWWQNLCYFFQGFRPSIASKEFDRIYRMGIKEGERLTTMRYEERMAALERQLLGL